MQNELYASHLLLLFKIESWWFHCWFTDSQCYYS